MANESNTLQTVKATKSVDLTLDPDLNILIVIYRNSSTSIQQKDVTANMSGSTNTFTKKTAQPASYHAGFYYRWSSACRTAV
jgi:hypothetical protein